MAGDGEYSPPDDTVTWPNNSRVWYANKFLQVTASNVVFALFSEGMLKVCDKLSNPMTDEDTSFSETLFGNVNSLSVNILFQLIL